MRIAAKTSIAILLTAGILTFEAAARAADAPAFTEDEAFAKLAAYKDGDDDGGLHALEAMVEKAAGSAEARARLAGRLAGVLGDGAASPGARLFAAKLLRLTGGEAQVPHLAKLLLDPATSEIGRLALGAIPGEAATAALREAAGKLEGLPRVAAIHSLGVRCDEGSVETLGKLLAGPDPAAAVAAAWSLGEIGGLAAFRSLGKAAESAAKAIRPTILEARLKCAGRVPKEGRGEAVQFWMDLLGSGTPAERAAALAGIAKGAPESAVGPVLDALADRDPLVRGTAIEAAVRHQGAAPTAALIGRLRTTRPDTAALEVLARRGDRAARPAVEGLLASKDEAVRLAAIRALGSLGDSSSVDTLVKLAAAGGPTGDAALRSLIDLRAPGAAEKIIGHVKGLRLPAIRAAAATTSPGAEEAILEATKSSNAEVHVAAVEALADVGTLASYPKLTAIARSGAPGAAAARKAIIAIAGRAGAPAALEVLRKDLDLRQASDAEAYLAIAAAEKGPGKAKAFEDLRKFAKDAAGKKVLLGALAGSSDAAALELAASFLEDPEVAAEARTAARKCAGAVVRREPRAAAEPVKKLLALEKDPAAVEELKAILAEVERAPIDPATALARDPARSAAQKEALAKRAPRGFALAAYLDCGPDTQDGKEPGPVLRLAAGTPHFWPGADRGAPVRSGTIFFDGGEVVFELTGLKAERSYRLGWSWWDYDSNGRVETVLVANGKGERERVVVDRAVLPGFAGEREAPAEKTIALPRELYGEGSLRIAFRNEGSTNAVVSEIWLWERGEGGAADAAEAPAASAAPQAAPAGKETQEAPKGPRLKVLLLTGDDYPGHLWKQTAPVLAEGLRKDPRFEVTVVEKPEFLASPDLQGFDVLVLHWMNWEKPEPPGSREGFKKLVEAGKGVLLVHFACGAFQGWPEFREIAGRSYDPKLRGHDPHGKFKVEIVDRDHPITKGLEPFEIEDELYTCLAGERKIRVLATSRSKVDGKDYPMVFTNEHGKGRVVHCPLGHDVKAVGNPGAAELFRRSCAWLGRLDP